MTPWKVRVWFWRGYFALIAGGVLAFVLGGAGCALLPASLKFEAEHTSHPTVGWPTGGFGDEDVLNTASALLHWRGGVGYVDAGLGRNLRGANGGGVYGPSLIGTVRVGVEVPLREVNR